MINDARYDISIRVKKVLAIKKNILYSYSGRVEVNRGELIFLRIS